MGSERYNRTFSPAGLNGLQIWRHLVQLISFVVLNGKIFGLGATAVIVPYLHSIQSPFSTAYGAYESLEYSITRGVFPLLVLGIIYFTAVTVGRVFCGWACPFGMVQDFLSYIPVKKDKLSASTASSLRDIKWAVVAFSVLSAILAGYKRTGATDAPVGVFSDAPFTVTSPSDTLFTYIPWMMLWKSDLLATVGLLGWLKLGLLLAILAPSIYIPRFFCRYVCPMGALLGPFSRFKSLRIARSTKVMKEDLNKLLADVCPMGVVVESDDSDFIDSPSCIHCGRCVTEKPTMLSQKVVL